MGRPAQAPTEGVPTLDGPRVHAARTAAGHDTIESWAAAIRCSASKARMIEAGQGDVKLSLALRILRALGRGPDELESILDPTFAAGLEARS